MATVYLADDLRMPQFAPKWVAWLGVFVAVVGGWFTF